MKKIKLKESDIQRIVKRVLTEQKEYKDDDFDYSRYKGINTSKIESEIKNEIRRKSHSMSWRNGYPEGETTIMYTDPNLVNPHLEQDIKRLAKRIMYGIYENALVYLGDNYEGDIVDIMNGDFN